MTKIIIATTNLGDAEEVWQAGLGVLRTCRGSAAPWPSLKTVGLGVGVGGLVVRLLGEGPRKAILVRGPSP